ncbi:type VII secretion protein EssA [Halobacillus naozhouensis]|uniref:Type VII secretion protein EssA n=1 Tax=Halobacillus naozhouensis TaxID=554880 RepID=A0ABY8IUX1_9BACI|nr:type VII secretion protein EssA [Halobacillus naozhouensis]WFT73934.1 type VII secretion protein EssA [Halobacillus naozhouensis]
MTFKKLNLFLLMVAAVFFLPPVVNADEGELNIEPHYYEEKRIILEIDRHSDDQSQRIESLPEEIMNLTFDSGGKATYQEIKNILFSSSNTEDDSIKGKASRLDLFTAAEEDESSSLSGKVEADTAQGNQLGLSILLGLIVLLLVFALFFLLLPRMKEQTN